MPATLILIGKKDPYGGSDTKQTTEWIKKLKCFKQICSVPAQTFFGIERESKVKQMNECLQCDKKF